MRILCWQVRCVWPPGGSLRLNLTGKDHGLSPSPARVGEVRVPQPQEGSGKEEAFPEIPRRMTKKQSNVRVCSVTCAEPRRQERGQAGAPTTQQRMRLVWLSLRFSLSAPQTSCEMFVSCFYFSIHVIKKTEKLKMKFTSNSYSVTVALNSNAGCPKNVYTSTL